MQQRSPCSKMSVAAKPSPDTSAKHREGLANAQCLGERCIRQVEGAPAQCPACRPTHTLSPRENCHVPAQWQGQYLAGSCFTRKGAATLQRAQLAVLCARGLLLEVGVWGWCIGCILGNGPRVGQRGTRGMHRMKDLGYAGHGIPIGSQGSGLHTFFSITSAVALTATLCKGNPENSASVARGDPPGSWWLLWPALRLCIPYREARDARTGRRQPVLKGAWRSIVCIFARKGYCWAERASCCRSCCRKSNGHTKVNRSAGRGLSAQSLCAELSGRSTRCLLILAFGWGL
jgi:hypothetical protein